MKKVFLQILFVCIGVFSCTNDDELLQNENRYSTPKLNVHFYGFTSPEGPEGTRAIISKNDMDLTLEDNDEIGVIHYISSRFVFTYPDQTIYSGSECNNCFLDVEQYHELLGDMDYILYWPYDGNYGINGVNEIRYENTQYIYNGGSNLYGLPIHYFSGIVHSEDDGSLDAVLHPYEGLLKLTIRFTERRNWHSVRIEDLHGDSIFSSALSYAPYRADGGSISPFTQNNFKKSITVNLNERNFENKSSFIVYIPIMPTYIDSLKVVITDRDRNSYIDTIDVCSSITSGTCISATLQTFDVYHETIDLGLPSGRLWAKFNVGADRTNTYRGNTYTRDERNSIAAEWGRGWRLPSKNDWDELMEFNGGFRNFSWYEGLTFAYKGIQNTQGEVLCFPYISNTFLDYMVADSVPYALDIEQPHYMYSDHYSTVGVFARLVRDPE